MNTQNTTEKQNKISPTVYLVAAILAATAGFLAVYVNFGPIGNADKRPAEQKSKLSTSNAQKEAVQMEPGTLKGLNTGEMGSFVVHKEPKSIPNFTFVNAKGDRISISDWRGKVVLLNLWATWCAPCRKEMPALDDLKARLAGDEFDVVAISIDRGGPDKPKEFFDTTNIKSLEFYIDDSGKLYSSLKAIGMPTTLLLSREGKEIGRLVGPAEWNSEDAIRLIQAAIGLTSPKP